MIPQDYITIAIVAVAFFTAAFTVFRKFRAGKKGGSCGCGCSSENSCCGNSNSCGGCSSCDNKDEAPR